MIPHPTVLATLPPARHSQDRKFRTATIQSLTLVAASKDGGEQSRRETVRRKQRPEVVVACPNGAVQIYDIHSARQITSYASLPGSIFVCNPVSALVRSGTKGEKRRVTAAAVLATTGKRAGKIVVWEERLGHDVPLREKIRMFQQETNVEGLVRLDLSFGRGATGDGQYQVIGIGQTGRMACWTEGLRDCLVGDGPPGTHNFREAFVIGVDQAKEGILKSRDDVSAPAVARGVEEILVSLTSAPAKKRKESATLAIHFHGLPFRLPDPATASEVKKFEALGSVSLPLTSAYDPAISSYTFFNFGASLISSSSDHLVTFDLSQTIPKQDTSLRIPRLSSTIPISENVVVATNDGSLNVIDTRYQAILASRPLGVEEKPNGIPNGVDHDSTHEKAGLELIAFFSSTGSICAIEGNTLVTYQVEGEDAPKHPRKKLKHTTLADAIGRGLGVSQATSHGSSGFKLSSEFGVPEASEPLGKEWDAEARKFEQFAREGDSKGFDKLMRSCLSSPATIHPRKLDHILSLVFAVTDDSSKTSRDSTGRSLQLQVWASKTLEFFNRRQCLSQGNIEEALKRTGRLSVVERLHPTAVVTAVAHANVKTMKKLKILLNFMTSLSAREVMCAIRLALQRLQQQQNLEQMQLLTAGPAAEEGDDDAMKQDHEPTPSTITPKHIPYTHDVIRLSLHRLTSLHPSTYADALAAEFSPPDLFALIDYLRLALARSGWFARHEDMLGVSTTDGDDDADHEEPNDAATALTPGAPHPGLSSTVPADHNASKDKDGAAAAADPLAHSAHLAVTLLNTALDALGTQGWLLTDPPSAAATLGHMRAEVSAALEGVEEAAYLAGLLAPVLQFAGTVPPGAAKLQHQYLQLQQQHLKKPSAAAPIVLATSKAQTDTDVDVDEARALPLGMTYVAPGGPAARLDDEAMRRVRAGGEVRRRTARDVGRVKSMRVGVHSFERILL